MEEFIIQDSWQYKSKVESLLIKETTEQKAVIN